MTRNLPKLLAVLALLAVCCPQARANLTIIPSFDSSITSGANGNAATIEATINAAISNVESHIENPITVNIDFENMSSGLGSSSTYIASIGYSTYRSALMNNQTLSANDVTAIASLPAGSTNPVNGNANVTLTLPILRALGFTANPPAGQPDSTIGLNLGITNISRSSPTVGNYDLEAVAAHEIDEVLGIGGPGSQLPTTNGAVGPLDLFRYSAAGVRSFTTSTSATPYFSINGGTTDLVHFNEAGGGSDYSDWGDGVPPADGMGNTPPQVQDAFGSPYEGPGDPNEPNIGTNELIALDVIGYNLVTIPEPGSVYLLAAGGLIALGVLRRGRRKTTGPGISCFRD